MAVLGNIGTLGSKKTKHDVKQYSCQFSKTFSPTIDILHYGTLEQRSENILDYLTNADKTVVADADFPFEITTNANGNFLTFPNATAQRLNIDINMSFTLQNPPFDRGFQVHINRGLNNTIVDDRSRSAQIRNFSLVNPGQVSLSLYTFAQGLTDPYYQQPQGGFGLLVENVTSTNSYQIERVKIDLIATLQQE